MGYTSDLRGYTIIDDDNAHLYVNQVMDPDYPFSGGYIPDESAKDPFQAAIYTGPIYSDSDLEDMIREADERGTSLDHLHQSAEVPILDQNGLPYCATDKTEVLTDHGWVKWPDYKDHMLLATVNPQTHMMEYQRPTARQVFEYKGELVCSTNRRVKFAMTPQHRMYVRKWDESKRTLSNQYSFTTADQLGWYSGLLPAPKGYLGTNLVEVEVEGDRCYDGDDFFALLALVISCGYAGGSESTKNWVSFCCFDENNYEAVAALARRVGFHESPSRRGVWSRYDAADLANWIRRQCYTSGELGATNKRVPRLLHEASARQIKHFLMWFGDQDRKNPMTRYDTSSWQLVGDLQELLLKVGKRSTPSERAPGEAVLENGQVIRSKTGWRLCVGDVDRLCLDRKKHIESDRYNGSVYCATVPNGTLVTRYEGTVLISGNCWCYGFTGAVMLRYAYQGLQVPHLSATSLAAKIKNYEKVGGWAKEALAGAERFGGIATLEHWPEHACDPRYDTAESRESASHHGPEPRIGAEELPAGNFGALVSSLLSGWPTTMGLGWWGHLVYGLKPVVIERGSLGVLICNSWKKSWEQGGKAVLRKEKCIADEMLAIKAVRHIRAA